MIEAASDVDGACDVEFQEAEFWMLLKLRQIAARAGNQIIQADDAVAIRQQAVA